MHIGVNCFPLRADSGGQKQYFFTLFRELLAHDSENTYVFFYYLHNAEELANLGTDRWRTHAILLQDQSEVEQHLDKIDVYFCPFHVAWPRPIPKPSVVSLPDIQEVDYPEFFTPADRFTRAWHYSGSTRLVDIVITFSNFSKQKFVKHHRVSPNKIVVIPHAADERYYRSSALGQAPSYALYPSFIFYPSNRWKHKNHDNLLKALQILRRQHDLSIQAVFTGYDVPNGYNLAQMAAQYGVSDQVHELGYVSVEEMVYLYCKAHLLVFPSLYEGFGLPILEAMAAGCPVVCSNRTSLPEVAKDAAVYFDPISPEQIAQAIKEVWYDEKLRRRLVELGKHRSVDFSVAKMAQGHRLAFKQAMEAYSSARYRWNYLFYQHYHRMLVRAKWELGLYS